jgi:PAS domain S-box-containing protein
LTESPAVAIPAAPTMLPILAALLKVRKKSMGDIRRLYRSTAAPAARAAGAWIAYWLSPPTPQEHERRQAHLSALLLVAVAGTAKHVAGLTDGSATYTLYGLAIALSALGGFGPACVAMMTAVLLIGVDSHSGSGWSGRLLFALEGSSIGGLVSSIVSRLHQTEARLGTIRAANDDLRHQARRDHLTQCELRHFEQVAEDAAVFCVNAQGLIVDWSESAKRLYGYTAEDMVGSSVVILFSEAGARTAVPDWLTPGTGPAFRSSVHRRSDGTRIHVEFDVRRCGAPAVDHVTLGVRDLSRRRESAEFREAAHRGQLALQQAADEARAQVAALESLTDPSVNPVDGLAAVGELLERLRSTIRADGVALMHLGRTGTRVISVAGLQPAQAQTSGTSGGSATDGRVTLVHNDPMRVAQVSPHTWPLTVSSIMVVPLCCAGPAAFRIEVVNERQAPASEWDLVLARIVADRLSQGITQLTPASI